MRKLKVEYRQISELKAYPGNVKKHPAEQIEQIKKSIQEFGMNDPIGIYENGEIAEGHGRLIACSELGMDTVPVILLDGLTEEEKRLYRIVHNKLTMDTGFDLELLASELERLAGDYDMEEYGFDDAEGFDDEDVQSLFADAEPKEPKKEEITCPYCGAVFEV